MSKCIDCLHYNICTFGKCDSISGCPFYTNRSEWVHLPCNIGKTAYFIRNNKIIETAVEKIIIKKNGIYLKLSCNAMYETSCKSIGKTVFFDQEEAEKALEGIKDE